MTDKTMFDSGPRNVTVTNAEQIRETLRNIGPVGRGDRGVEQDTRSLQLGLEVQRHQMQRSLTHALLGVVLSLQLLMTEQSGTATRLIAGGLVAHILYQFFDFHRALSYYNRGVNLLNLKLVRQHTQQLKKLGSHVGVINHDWMQDEMAGATTRADKLREQLECSEFQSWVAGLLKTNVIDWPRAGDSTSSLSSRARAGESARS